MRLRHLVARTVCLIALPFAVALAANAQATPEAAVRHWLDAFNAGHMDLVASYNSASGTSIIDEFAPYSWSGASAFSDWSAGFDADAKTRGITDPKGHARPTHRE